MRDINYKNAYKLIDKADIVSFDVFDTLITRMVSNPTQIFDIVQEEYNKKNKKRIYDFKKNRIYSEKNVNVSVPTLCDIYSEMIKYYEKDECIKLEALEIEIEKKYCVANQRVKNLYYYCVENNKEIYITSDMYLNKEAIKSILEKNGYNKFKDIIVSCEYGTDKKSGNLFKNIEFAGEKKVLHIGDSLRADLLGAKKNHFLTFRVNKKCFKNNSSNMGKILECENSELFYKIGYSTIGPVLLSFINWLYCELKNKKIKKVFFLAREGRIFKDVFDLLYGDTIDTKYLCISRKAITISNYNNINIKNLNDIITYFTIKKDSTVSDVYNYLELNNCNGEHISKTNIYDLTGDNDFFEKINSNIKEKSKLELGKSLKYFVQENVEGRFAVVDIGWNGTMQKNLEIFLNNNEIVNNIYGYYFTLFKKIKNGYSFIEKGDKVYSAIYNNPILLENIFQYVDGSTTGYYVENNIIKPKKKKIEFDDYSIEAINNIDCGIIDFIKCWNEYGFFLDSKIVRKESLEGLNKFICKPTWNNVKAFEKFKYSDIKESYIISNYNSIRKNLYYSGWKYGYLKKILKLNYNFDFIIKVLKEISK